MATLTIEITDIPAGSPLATLAAQAERAAMPVSSSHMNLVYMLAIDVATEAKRIHSRQSHWDGHPEDPRTEGERTRRLNAGLSEPRGAMAELQFTPPRTTIDPEG